MWYNPIMIWILYSPLHGLMSGNTMVISLRGRKSGKAYRVPVGYLRSGYLLLTLSYKQRTWWKNLRGGGEVDLRLQGRDVKGHSEVVEDEQGVIEGIKTFIAMSPIMAKILDVSLGDDGQPEPESLVQAASRRILVKTTLR